MDVGEHTKLMPLAKIIEAVETAHKAWKMRKDEEAEIKRKKNKD